MRTTSQVIKKVAFDFKLQGAYAIHVVWNRERTEIVELFHVPVERVRAGRPNEMGVVDCYYISADWGNTRTNKPYPVPAFNVPVLVPLLTFTPSINVLIPLFLNTNAP